MKSNKIAIMGALLLTLLTASSCREESDALQTYDHPDVLTFEKADSSFAEKFKILWNGLNQYYAVWDYEKENGVDWDAIYDEYLPQFEELDKRDAETNPVTRQELEDLMNASFGQLHDGHLALVMKNHHLLNAPVPCIPARLHNESRDDYEVAQGYDPSLDYYAASGDIITDESGQPLRLECDTRHYAIITNFNEKEGIGIDWAEAKIEELQNEPLPTDGQLMILQGLKNLVEDADKVYDIATFNVLAVKYAYLEVPGLTPIDPAFEKVGLNVKTAVMRGTRGAITYFHLSDFMLTAYLDEMAYAESFTMKLPSTDEYVQGVQKVWTAWFEATQELHKEGLLDGVIIDVRGNSGGMVDDAQFVVGSLLPAGGYQYGYSRFKRGTGRLDYSPLTPAIAQTMSEEHQTITEPVVILTNSGSVSMSELSTLCVKRMDNGTVIGKRTWGGLCGLSDNTDFSRSYVGHIGDEKTTPVYGYVPFLAVMDMDKKYLESVGVTPDIEADLDTDLFKATRQDTQLNRALQFIRTGK